jgi:hypothetical protein
MKPFLPPSTPAAAREELTNLHGKLKRFADVAQLPKNASQEEVREKVNELTALLCEITKAGTVRRI